MTARSEQDVVKAIAGGLILCFAMLYASVVHACTPILPLAQALSPTQYMARSVIVLLVAVAIKAVVFAVFEKSIGRVRAVVYMILANVMSSVIGFVLVLAAAAPILIVVSLPAIYVVSRVPAQRLITFNPWGYFGRWKADLLAAGLVVLYVLTFVMFGLGQSMLSDGRTGVYWIVKFGYIFVALIISILLTTLWEEWVISALAKRRHPGISFLPNVLRANLITLIVVVGYSAATMLPKRLASPDFLI